MNKKNIKQKVLSLFLSGNLIIGLSIGFSFIQNNIVQASDPIKVTRLSGTDRFDTSTKISQYFGREGYYVVLVNNEDYPDAVSIAPLAKKFEAPILLVNKDNIPDNIKQELIRLKTKRVFIIGGKGVISENVENQLNSLGIVVEERIAGQDRFETCAKIAHHLISSTSNAVYAVEDEDWRNALSLSGISGWNQCPIVLVGKDSVSNSIKQSICNEFHNYFLIGETNNQNFINNSINGLTSNGIAIKSLGSTKEDTNVEIYNTFKKDINLEKVYLVNSNDIPDAISLGYLTGLSGNMILFVNQNNLTPTENFLYSKANDIKELVVVGGEGVLPQSYINGLYNKMMEYKTRQESIDLNKQQTDWNNKNNVSIPTPIDPNYGKETHKITLLKTVQFMCNYLQISQEKIGLEDYLVETKNNIIIEDNNNLIGHMCTFFNLSETELNYTYIIDRDTGNLYEKIDKNNKDSKKYKILKNILNQ